MEDDRTRINGLCKGCGCNEAQATADARALGFEDEFQAGIYNCCQVVQWADEQWFAWLEAAEADGKTAEEVTRPLEIGGPETLFVPVYIRHPRLKGGSFDDLKS